MPFDKLCFSFYSSKRRTSGKKINKYKDLSELPFYLIVAGKMTACRSKSSPFVLEIKVKSKTMNLV